MRIEPVADAVAHAVEADHHGEDRKARERGNPPLVHEFTSLGYHRAPFRSGRYHAEAKERQAGEYQDRIAQVERDEYDQRADGVRHDLAEQDVHGAEADRL